MTELQRIFSVIEDTRHQGYVEHKLADVLTMVMCAVLQNVPLMFGGTFITIIH